MARKKGNYRYHILNSAHISSNRPKEAVCDSLVHHLIEVKWFCVRIALFSLFCKHHHHHFHVCTSLARVLFSFCFILIRTEKYTSRFYQGSAEFYKNSFSFFSLFPALLFSSLFVHVFMLSFTLLFPLCHSDSVCSWMFAQIKGYITIFTVFHTYIWELKR